MWLLFPITHYAILFFLLKYNKKYFLNSSSKFYLNLNLLLWLSTLVSSFAATAFQCLNLPNLKKKIYQILNTGNFFFFQFSSVSQSCPSLCDPMDCLMPGLPVHHQLLELTQTHVHWVSDAIQPSHPPLSPSPPDFNFSQHQGLFKWVSSSHQVTKGLELQHQSFQWIFRTDFR